MTANRDGAEEFGVKSDQIFDFWDWVGGRYSVWSAVGLSLQLAFGPDAFDEFLAGAAAMDKHFKNASLEKKPAGLDGADGDLEPERSWVYQPGRDFLMRADCESCLLFCNSLRWKVTESLRAATAK